MFDRILLWQMFLLIRVTQETNSAVYLGCFIDGTDFLNTRVLEKELYEHDDNTREKCIQDCYAAGYTFSGTENGDECWCGNAIMRYDNVSDSECNEPCSGNKEDNCGDGWRISIYNITSMHRTTHEQTTDDITSAVNVNQSTSQSTQASSSSSDKSVTSITDASSPKTDENKTDDGGGTLTLLYVLVPIAVTAVFITVLVSVLCKRRRKRKCLVPDVVYSTTGLTDENPIGGEHKQVQERKHSSVEQAPQMIYNRTETGQDVAESEYNTLGQEISKQLITDRTYDHVNTKDKLDDTYDHVDANEKSLLDKTYSNLSEHKKEKTENAVLDTYSHIAKTSK